MIKIMDIRRNKERELEEIIDELQTEVVQLEEDLEEACRAIRKYEVIVGGLVICIALLIICTMFATHQINIMEVKLYG